jgi:outer membrane autotransporter protein
MASTTSLSRELKGLGDTVRLMPPGVIFKQWIKAEPLKSLNQWHARYAAAPTCSPGALLRGTFGSAGTRWQPYLKGNVWWGSNGFDTVSFNSFGIPTGRNGGATLEGGGGVTGKLTRNVSVYGDASYLSSLSGESRVALKGNVGLRLTW